MAQASWHSCSKLSPSISSSKQPRPPCSAQKTKPLQGKGEGRGRVNAPSSSLGRQSFSTLALPRESPGAQDLGSDLMTKMEPMSHCWCVLSVVPPPAAPCQEDVEVEEDAGELTFLGVPSFFEGKYLLLAIISTEVLWPASPKSCGSQKRKVWELRKPAVGDKVLPDESCDCYEQNWICTSGHTTLCSGKPENVWMLHSLQKEGKTGFFSFIHGTLCTCVFVDIEIMDLLE